jgi:hypothetical protein
MLIGILPFIQLGVSYYASVGVVGALVILWYQREHLVVLLERMLIARLAVVALMVIFTWGYPGSQDVLRSVREGVFFFLATGSAGWTLHSVRADVSRATRYARLLCLGLLALAVVQTVFLSRGVYFGIPKGLFSQNGGVIASDLDLYYSDIRPNGPYGEPSYLGAVCLCLLFAFGPLLLKSRLVNHSSALALATVMLSRSFSGLLFCMLMVFANLWKLVRSFATRLAVAAVIVAVCTLVLSTENTVTTRLDRLRSGEDVSSMARVFQPATIIPDILTKSPTGIPMTSFMDMGYVPAVGVYTEDLVHNGLLNLIINYGWAGFLAIGVWMLVLPNLNSCLFVLLLSMQNGAFLTPDKFVLIALSMMIYNACRHKAPAAASGVKVRQGALPLPDKTVYRPITDVQPWN